MAPVLSRRKSRQTGIEIDKRGANEAGTTAKPSQGTALSFAAGTDNYAHGQFGTITPRGAHRIVYPRASKQAACARS